MSNQFCVAVVGATGAVGEVMLSILAERKFPAREVHALASANSAGSSVDYGDSQITVKDLATFDFSGVDFALFSAGSSVSEKYAPIAADAGAIVIDNTSQFRYQDDIPLIVPEVNMDKLASYDCWNIIANPNCSTIQMLVALAPLHEVATITSINVSTYQAVSGSGKIGIEELSQQSGKILNGNDLEDKDIVAYPSRIAFNVIPQIDVWQENGFSKEEMKMSWETKKILDPEIEVNATCVRVPVFYGHSEAVHITTREPLSPQDACAILQQTAGVNLMTDDYPTTENAANDDAVWVGRIRPSLIEGNYGLNLWIVSDNIRKGAALNSIQIAEQIIQKGMI